MLVKTLLGLSLLLGSAQQVQASMQTQSTTINLLPLHLACLTDLERAEALAAEVHFQEGISWSGVKQKIANVESLMAWFKTHKDSQFYQKALAIFPELTTPPQKTPQAPERQVGYVKKGESEEGLRANLQKDFEATYELYNALKKANPRDLRLIIIGHYLSSQAAEEQRDGVFYLARWLFKHSGTSKH